MKFFEVKSPYYYALIAAKNEEECAELYEQVEGSANDYS